MEVNNADQAEVWFNAFLEAYINTALSLITGGETRSQIMPAALAEIFEDCDAFVDSNWEALKNLAPEACGADFFLTRNGHGCLATTMATS